MCASCCSPLTRACTRTFTALLQRSLLLSFGSTGQPALVPPSALVPAPQLLQPLATSGAGRHRLEGRLNRWVLLLRQGGSACQRRRRRQRPSKPVGPPLLLRRPAAMELASHGTNGRHADDRRDTKESKLSDWSALGGGKDAAGASSGHTPSPPPEVAAVAGHFVQRPWNRRFASQFPALLWKNLLVQWRNWRATVLRILAPL